MRPITITLMANDGQGGAASTQSISARLAKVGRLGWSLDEEFTKLKPGNLTVQVWDEDGAVWDWIETQISTVVDTVNQLLPPWVMMTVGGTRRFLGVLDIPTVRRDQKSRIIELSAQDWSIMLRDAILDGTAWERPFPRIGGSSRGNPGPFLAMPFVIYDPVPGAMYVNPAGTLDIQEGDTVRHQPTGTGFVVGPVFDGRLTTPPGTGVLFSLIGWTNGEGYPAPWTLTRDVTMDTLSDQHYYLATVGFDPNPDTPGYTLQLDTVDQLIPGDVLTTITGGEVAVNDVDSERKEVISLEPITAQVGMSQKLYLSQESRETLIYEDAGVLLRRAAMPYPVDLSRLNSPTLARPILAWLPLRSNGRDLMGARDIEPTLTNLKVWGTSTLSWTGSPDLGWTPGSGTTRTVPWTTQLTAAPALLMPDEMPALAPSTGFRHRAYYEWKYTRPVLLDSSWNPITPSYTPAPIPPTILCHDYNQLRRLKITGTSVLEQRWNGSAWSAGTTITWPVAGWKPAVAVPMPGVAATTGPVAPQGQAILAICSNAAGTAWELQLVWAGAAVRLALPATLAGSQLRTTPWGAYLLGPGGYGRITYAAGSLAIAWAGVRGAGQAVLLPSTFAAIDSTSVWCFCQITTTDKENKTQTEVHLMQLTTTPDPTGEASPILSSEMISKGAPRLAVCVKDPTAARLVGLLGGRLFQIAAKLPATIERVRAYGMTGAELIEHIAQALCAMVVPLPSGTLQIVSRAVGTPTALTVDRVAVTQNRLSSNFFSAVRVSGQNDTYADAFGAWSGGRVLEIQNQPLLWTEGGCFALASAFAQFHGIPRREESQDWFHENADTAPPWESLAPWMTLTVPGSSRTWLLTGLDSDVVEGTATAKLLEAP